MAIAMMLMSVFALAPSALAADYSATVNANPNADGTSQTGASVLPYVAVVVLLAVAGVAFLALRKKSR